MKLRIVIVVAFLCSALSSPALAHSMYQAAVILDFTGSVVHAELQLPVERVGTALNFQLNAQTLESQRVSLTEYIVSRLHAILPNGRAFAVRLSSPVSLAAIDGAPYLVANLILAPPEQSESDLFDLKDDVLLERIAAQVALVSIRSDWRTSTFANNPKLVGVLRADHRSVRIDRTNASWARGFGSIFHLGMRHIAEGTDHLLFLLVLLLPAPLLVFHQRWAGFAGVHHSLLQILKVVTAFTLGHSLTLAAAALGLIHVPGRPIEVLIAVSILVSAIHALRPLFPGREAVIAACFGLVHGMAFGTTLAELGLSRWERVASIFGFNLGIETMQLVVVAAIMPSFILLSRTRLYPVIRIAGALFAGLASIGWIGERLFQMSNPLESIIETLAQHAWWIAIALCLLALLAWSGQKAFGETLFTKGKMRCET